MPLLTEERTQEYINFLKENPKGHFLQSPEWAKVKIDWKNVIFESAQDLIAL